MKLVPLGKVGGNIGPCIGSVAVSCSPISLQRATLPT